MPLFTYRASMLFFQQGYGWSETWFRQQTTAGPDFSTSIAALQALISARAGIMGNTTYINGGRLSCEQFFRDVVLVNYAGTGNSGTVGALGISDAPATCLLSKHNPTSINVPSSIRPLRGLPDSMVTNGGLFVPTAGFNAAYSAYKASITAGGWGWMGASQRTPGIVQNVTQTVGLQTATLTLRAPLNPLPPLNVPIYLSVSGVQGASQINGRRRYTTPDGQIFVTLDRLLVSAYVAGGKALYSGKSFILDAGTGQFTRVAERKPGKPFYLSAGRKRVQRAA